MPRDNRAGSSSRCSAAREPILSPCAESHRTIDPDALKNPRAATAESTLTENVASPFHAEPRQPTLAMSGIRSLFLSPVRSHIGTTASHPNLRNEANTFFVFVVSLQFCKDGRRIGPFLVVLRFHYFLAPP